MLNIVYTINRWSLDHSAYICTCTLYNTGGHMLNIVYTKTGGLLTIVHTYVHILYAIQGDTC